MDRWERVNYDFPHLTGSSTGWRQMGKMQYGLVVIYSVHGVGMQGTYYMIENKTYDSFIYAFPICPDSGYNLDKWEN